MEIHDAHRIKCFILMCLPHRFAHIRHEEYCAEKKVGNL